eukprot:TRINITY_DN17874_c0_g1_i3.p1 TRINITY_DN17874_c0_g1~~TRINITY_DN17874_c0_g1_i3.p1  ORF type:complete len:600 (-),score=134.05 TRINITY_DN17874_c0_g1_i3:128-1927(-)
MREMEGPSRFLVLLLVSVIALALAKEGSCPAGGNGAACRAAAEASSKQATTRKAVPTGVPSASKGPQVDLLTQEIEELEALMKLGKGRMELLQELKTVAASNKATSLSEAQRRSLKEQLPLISEVARQGEATPTAANEDYLVVKSILPMEEAVSRINFLLLRNQRPSTSSSKSSAAATQTAVPSAALAASQADGTVRLFSPSGELLHSFSSGHEQPITQMAVSPTHEEHLIVTGDDSGTIRLHKVNVRQRRLEKDHKRRTQNSAEEKVSQYLGSQLNITTQLQKEMQLTVGSSGSVPKLTSLAIGSMRNVRHVVAGDAEGRISVFMRNGTVKATIDATAMEGNGVEELQAFHTQLMFRAGMEWGYVNLEKNEVKHIDCPKFEGRVASLTVDSQQMSRVLLSDESGNVWVFNVKNRKDCELEKKFPPAALINAPIELASIKGFAVGLQKAAQNADAASLLAINMSQHVGRRRPGEIGPGQHVVWRRPRHGVKDWSLQKRVSQGDLIALLSEDGKEIEILELLMQVYTPPPASDPFTNFKLPIVACALVLVLGYQYMKKGMGARGGGRKDFGKSDFASLMKQKKLAGMKGGLGKGLGKKFG